MLGRVWWYYNAFMHRDGVIFWWWDAIVHYGYTVTDFLCTMKARKRKFGDHGLGSVMQVLEQMARVRSSWFMQSMTFFQWQIGFCSMRWYDWLRSILRITCHCCPDNTADNQPFRSFYYKADIVIIILLTFYFGRHGWMTAPISYI